MADPQTTKMLQAILNGQSAIKQELITRIDKVEKRLEKTEEGLEAKIDKVDQKLSTVERNLTKRIDKIGRQLAYLEDDAPTREEHDKLVKRVDRLEQKVLPQHTP